MEFRNDILIFLDYVYVGLVLAIAFVHGAEVIFVVIKYFLTSFSPVGYLDG